MTAMLATDAYVDVVVQDQQLAAAMGARGVPFFVFRSKIGVSGAAGVGVRGGPAAGGGVDGRGRGLGRNSRWRRPCPSAAIG